MVAAAGAGGEWEICNDDGFVYKRPRGLYPADRGGGGAAAPSTPAPSPETVILQRRRRALLHLRDKYLLELSRWEALSSDLLAPLPIPPVAPRARPASPLPVAASVPTTSTDLAVLDDLLAQAEVQEEMLKKLSQMCDEMDEFCSAHEAALVDAVTALPVWGNPRELMDSLCGPAEQTVPGTD